MNRFATEFFQDKYNNPKVGPVDTGCQLMAHIFLRFVYKGSDGSLLGPFCPLLYTVDVARAFFDCLRSIPKIPGLPLASREIAILATGSKWEALFEIYSHERIAVSGTHLTQQQIDLIKTGRKPSGLNEEEETAFDVTMELLNKMGPLPETMWQRAVRAFGKEGALALVHQVGFFSYLCVLCNGCNIPLPEGESIK
ncbi:hypothetical protein F5884DRAFT_803797 [Xylogone sp. PMI_703]|nr:hypothetical protein F5884DRAFT_803797 [Xylogone sp. PMI_703]